MKEKIRLLWSSQSQAPGKGEEQKEKLEDPAWNKYTVSIHILLTRTQSHGHNSLEGTFGYMV